jgi:hypothetical protein
MKEDQTSRHEIELQAKHAEFERAQEALLASFKEMESENE